MIRRAPTSAYDGAWLNMMTDLIEQTCKRMMVPKSSCWHTPWAISIRCGFWGKSHQHGRNNTRKDGSRHPEFPGAGTGVVQLVSGSFPGHPRRDWDDCSARAAQLRIKHDAAAYAAGLGRVPAGARSGRGISNGIGTGFARTIRRANMAVCSRQPAISPTFCPATT